MIIANRFYDIAQMFLFYLFYVLFICKTSSLYIKIFITIIKLYYYWFVLQQCIIRFFSVHEQAQSKRDCKIFGFVVLGFFKGSIFSFFNIHFGIYFSDSYFWVKHDFLIVINILQARQCIFELWWQYHLLIKNELFL